jgi:signal transduction histidine kinase
MADQSGADPRSSTTDVFTRTQIIQASFDRLDSELVKATRGDPKAIRNAQSLVQLLRSESDSLLHGQTELATLYRVLRDMESLLDLGELLGTLVDRAIALVQAERGMLVLCHREDRGFDVALNRRMEANELDPTSPLAFSRHLVRHVLETRMPVMTTDAQHDERFKGSSSILAFQIRSVLAAPLIYQQELIGAIYVDTRTNTRTFQKSDLKLLSALASQGAVAIHIATLYQDLETKNRQMARALKELAAAQEELIKAERLSAIGSMASAVIHDIKGPLTVIRGMAQLLGDANLTREQHAQFSGLITKSVDTMAGMTQEVLDFARGEQKLVKAEFSADGFLSELHEFMSREFAPQNIDVRMHTEYQGTVVGDRQKLWRAVYNIAKNGAEAMPQGGRLDTTVRSDGKYVEFVISDTGGGIPKEIRDKVFDPFRTFGKTHGTGLGLPIAKSILEAHGGNITFQTAVGEGTTFVLRLPLQSAHAF